MSWYCENCEERGEAAESALAEKAVELTNIATAFEWIEKHSTLHTDVEILYVVDGYEISVVSEDGRVLKGPFHGSTFANALAAAWREG